MLFLSSFQKDDNEIRKAEKESRFTMGHMLELKGMYT